MDWPWRIIALDEAQKTARRQSLDRHAAYAQLSALVPIALFLLYRFMSWVVKRLTPQRGFYSAVPGSPTLKRARRSTTGSLASLLRRFAWWFSDDVVFLGKTWGQRDQIIIGIIWTVWLMFLCVVDTGNDYIHLTKRFGIVALSQLPMQYLLALKSINPIAFVFSSSHEQVNRWHRVLGWIIYFLLFLHVSFFLNFYIQEGVLAERIVRLIPALGLGSFIGLSFMNTTALRIVRQYSYRVFFITHLIVAFSLPPAIFFHSHHGGREYVIEALAVFVLDIMKRRFDTITAPATLERIPGTSLVKIVASLPPKKLGRFRKYHGMHVYLSIPIAARRASGANFAAFLLFEATFNPFTIALVNEESQNLTLIARCQNGLMTKTLARLAQNHLTGTKIPLNIDGTYGCAKKFPSLTGSEFNRILLVAGGVGATYILPLYRLITTESPAARVRMVWAVREAGDATWPVNGTAGSILDDENLHLYLTGDVFGDADQVTDSGDEDDAIELASNLDTDSRRMGKRPDLKKIVDDFFKQGLEERVAVIVCGPEAMARELKSHVGVWVQKGRNVWWHNESFVW